MERQDAAPPIKTFSPQALFSRERAFREALLKLSRSHHFRVPARLESATRADVPAVAGYIFEIAFVSVSE